MTGKSIPLSKIVHPRAVHTADRLPAAPSRRRRSSDGTAMTKATIVRAFKTVGMAGLGYVSYPLLTLNVGNGSLWNDTHSRLQDEQCDRERLVKVRELKESKDNIFWKYCKIQGSTQNCQNSLTAPETGRLELMPIVSGHVCNRYKKIIVSSREMSRGWKTDLRGMQTLIFSRPNLHS